MSDLFSSHPRRRLSAGKYRKLCQYIAARDGHCLLCGNPYNGTPAHVVSRAQGGDDSKRNIIQLCVVRQDGSNGCHSRYDNSEIKLPEWAAEMLRNEDDIWK
jgi:hypothetical protein